MSTKHEQALHHLRAVLGFREGTTSYESAVAAMEKFLESEFAPPTKYTVFCRESSNQGTTWIDTVEVANGGQSASELLAEIRALAAANCAVDWGRPDPEGITCYCIIPGQPGILHFEDLGDN